MSDKKQATKVAVKSVAKPATKVADTKPATKPATKVAAKAAKKNTCKPLNDADFFVSAFEVDAKKAGVYLERLKDVHTLQTFLSTASLQGVREALTVESRNRGRADTLLRIIGRLGTLTKDHFCKKLGVARPKLTKTKKEDLI